MELKYIKELMAAMGRSGIKRLTLKQNDAELILERNDQLNGRPLETGENLGEFKPYDRMEQAFSKGGEPNVSLAESGKKKEDVNQVYIPSPMVGTFYTSPSPGDPPFVKPGDKIDKNTVVGIIEAMKVMNEIKAGVNGVIAEALVDSAQPVEFGTKLFRINE